MGHDPKACKLLFNDVALMDRQATLQSVGLVDGGRLTLVVLDHEVSTVLKHSAPPGPIGPKPPQLPEVRTGLPRQGFTTANVLEEVATVTPPSSQPGYDSGELLAPVVTKQSGEVFVL